MKLFIFLPLLGFMACSSRGPIMATGQAMGDKTGKTCAHHVLTLNVWGDNDIYGSAKQAGIDRISTVDSEVVNYLWVYQQKCTVVRGS
jgi:hypothetical protein